MRLLFAKHSLSWPRCSGHDVHAFHMMKACVALGHEVSLATVVEPVRDAVTGLRLTAQIQLDERQALGESSIGGTWLQQRFRSYYGVPSHRIAALARAATSIRPDAVVVVGLDVLPYFTALSGTTRIWYAADEWMWHHLSQLRLGADDCWVNLRDALVKGLYERAHANVIDRTWVVSSTERRAMRWLGGMRHVDELPNGVDATYYRPGTEPEQRRTAVFWGRLDFGPNIQALEWFCRRVWPQVRRSAPDAHFTIIGFQPSRRVRQLTQTEGVSLVANLADLRDTVRRQAVVVLPFVSGGGIKNKLLEAAAMGKAIVCTRRAILGLKGQVPVRVAEQPAVWERMLLDLWDEPTHRQQLGSQARAWVVREHSWEEAARKVLISLDADDNRCSARPGTRKETRRTLKIPS